MKVLNILVFPHLFGKKEKADFNYSYWSKIDVFYVCGNFGIGDCKNLPQVICRATHTSLSL